MNMGVTPSSALRNAALSLARATAAMYSPTSSCAICVRATGGTSMACPPRLISTSSGLSPRSATRLPTSPCVRSTPVAMPSVRQSRLGFVKKGVGGEDACEMVGRSVGVG